MLFRIACTLPLAVVVFTTNASGADVVDFAASLIGRPYIWGAEGPNAFDCSGLTQYVFNEFGIDLPRRAVNQADVGTRIARRLQRGDLVFFASDGRRAVVTHVGIYEGGGMMVNASKRRGRVGRDDLDDPFWTERFMFATRILAGDRDHTDSRPQDRPARAPERRPDGRREAARVLGRIAETLLRRLPR